MSDEEKKDVEEKVSEEPQTDSTTPTETPTEPDANEEAPKEDVGEETTETPTPETATEEAVEEKSDEAKKVTGKPEPAYKAKLVDFTELEAGMTIRVHERIKDVSPKGELRERIQVFEGMLLWLKGSGISRTMTVRKISKGFAVEKIYPINSPVVVKIELVKKARVRRAKLGYLKDAKRRFKRKLKETRFTLKK